MSADEKAKLDLKVGDPVFVIERELRAGTPIPATVTKVGRVWVTISAGRREWRMRLDTQDEDTGYGYGGSRFVTPGQLNREQAAIAADRVMKNLGITLSGQHWTPERRIALAALLDANTEILPEPVDKPTTQA